ncbi:MAG: RibD family protein [Candidatus Hodarchaeales archaeon]|jgi:riboflavin-specific deaminase-like protein
MTQDENMLRPKVILSAATSIDGLIASQEGDVQLSNYKDWKRVHRLRGKSDAIMVGSGTILTDNPKLTVKTEFFKENETFQNPIRVVVSSTGNIPLDSRVIHSQPEILTIIATTTKCPQIQKEKLRKLGCDLIICGDGPQVDLKFLLKNLLNQYQIYNLLVEGGSILNGTMLTNELIDEIHLAIAPVIGGSGTRFFTLPTTFNSFKDSPYFEFRNSSQVGDMICLTIVVHYHPRVRK